MPDLCQPFSDVCTTGALILQLASRWQPQKFWDTVSRCRLACRTLANLAVVQPPLPQNQPLYNYNIRNMLGLFTVRLAWLRRLI